MKGYDVHCHTSASDGKLALNDLVLLAKKSNLNGFAVTDHDILDASKQAKYMEGMDVISGIELSGKIKDYLIEVTGYFVNPFNKDLEETCRVNQEFRKARMRKIIYNINEKYSKKLGKEITYEEVLNVAKDGSIGLNHINNILIERGLFKGREAFFTCLNRNSAESCYCERDAVNLEYAVDAITASGGIVGIPHPALVHFDYLILADNDFKELMKSYFLSKKIKVIETDYPYIKVRPECTNIKGSEKFWRDAAREYKLIGVGGSDGHQKPDGPSLGERVTPKKTVDRIRDLAKQMTLKI